MRIPYSMRTMIDEIERVNPKAMVETTAPDGFGVWRALRLDATTTEMLSDLLDVLDDDRIQSKFLHNGQYTIGFVADHRADLGKPFSLDRAYRVATEPESAAAERGDDGPTRAQRKAELQKVTVANLRSIYGYSKSTKKAVIIDGVLMDEGY